MKINRLFGIIYLLLDNDTMTAKELSEYFEVSTRTIYRDIESLSEINIPIYMSKGKNGGIRLLDHYKFDKSLLTDEEQNQILFSLQGIHQLQGNTNDIYEKLKNIFSKDDTSWFEVDFSVWGHSNVHKANFEIIKNSIINKTIIKFCYFNSYGKHSQRKVEPYKLCFKYNSWYLYGIDSDKNTERFFKLMRMKNVKATNESFEKTVPVPIKREEHAPKMIQLVLQIDKELSYRVYDEFDEADIQISENKDFIVTTEYPFTDWIYSYILSFGEHIKVLAPEMIKNEIINKLKNNLNQYF